MGAKPEKQVFCALTLRLRTRAAQEINGDEKIFPEVLPKCLMGGVFNEPIRRNDPYKQCLDWSVLAFLARTPLLLLNHMIKNIEELVPLLIC